MMTDSNWSKNLKDIPEISHEYIDNWAEKDEKIPKAKQHKGYSNFVEGYVHDVEGKHASYTLA
jgi:hypothetical protein